MTKRDMMDIVIRAFGIYFLVAFIRTIPMTGIQFFVDTSEFIANRGVYLIFNVLHSLIPLVFACLFLFKSQAITTLLVKEVAPQADATRSQPAYAQLWFWITIIGLYYFVSSASALVGQLLRRTLEFTKYPMAFTGRGFWSNVVTLVISLNFIFGSKAIDSFIQKRTNKDTQPKDGSLLPENALTGEGSS